MKKGERQNKILGEGGRKAAAGLAGCLLVGLTVMCLPMNVSASEKITRENFDYVRYADNYQDLKEAFGYDAKALYNHYLNNGKAEGRIAYRNDGTAIEGAVGNQAEAANAGGTDQTAATGTKSENKIVTSDGWEWNEKWGMWVR